MKVLLVEDNQDVRYLLARAMREEGHDVTETSNFREAREALETDCRWQAVITDVIMIDGSGLDIGIESIRIGIPTLVITGHLDTMIGLQSTQVPHLRKPFPVKLLLKWLAEINPIG